MFAVVIEASAIVAFAEIVKYPAVNAFAVTSLVAVKLFAVALPVILTEPNVVLPPDAVDVNDSHARAFVSPSVGQTFNVVLDVSYQI